MTFMLSPLLWLKIKSKSCLFNKFRLGESIIFICDGWWIQTKSEAGCSKDSRVKNLPVFGGKGKWKCTLEMSLTGFFTIKSWTGETETFWAVGPKSWRKKEAKTSQANKMNKDEGKRKEFINTEIENKDSVMMKKKEIIVQKRAVWVSDF